MKLGARIFLCCFAIVCLCLYYPLNRLADAIAVHYRESVEDTLVDQANILASLVEEELRENQFSREKWDRAFSRMHERFLNARIYKLHKYMIDADIYITDEKGVVLFDSFFPSNVGKDFSTWRDVYLTLRGQYGARTTRRNEEDETSSVLHVAAAIHNEDGTMVGVLTVIKPTTNIRYFEAAARHNIQHSGILSVGAAGLLSLLVTLWLTRPIKRLTQYARAIRDGKHPSFPRLDSSEIGELGHALAEMQETLEGRRYVEQYVEHLTHELKSPLSAIRGAAELLGESSDAMDPDRRARFIANIDSQSRRIQEIVDRMLELASLESRSYQRGNETVSLPDLVRNVCAEKEPLMVSRDLTCSLTLPEQCDVKGDGFLLHQAVSNLVQNAIDFSPDKGIIAVRLETRGKTAVCVVEDDGPGIPEFAEQRIFEKFFSLQRPRTSQKSTGLGLNFVWQIAELHAGSVTLGNKPDAGCQAVFSLPKL